MNIKPHIKKNFLLFFKSFRTNIFTFVIFPMVMAFIYGNMQAGMFEGNDYTLKPINVKFIYNENSLEGNILSEVLKSEAIKTVIIEDKKAKDYEVVIDKTFNNIDINTKNDTSTEIIMLKSFLESFISNLNQYKLVQNIIADSDLSENEMRILQDNILESINALNNDVSIKESIVKGYKTISAREYYTISIFSFTIMILIQTLVRGFYKDKKEGIVRRSFAAPCEKKDYFIGFIISSAIIIFLITTIYIMINRLLGYGFLGNISVLLIVALVNSILGSAIAGVIIAFIKDEKMANSFISLLVIIPLAFGGVFFSVDFIDAKWFKVLSNFTPNSFLLNSYKDYAISGVFQSVGNEIMIISLLAISILLIGYFKVTRKWEV